MTVCGWVEVEVCGGAGGGDVQLRKLPTLLPVGTHTRCTAVAG